MALLRFAIKSDLIALIVIISISFHKIIVWFVFWNPYFIDYFPFSFFLLFFLVCISCVAVYHSVLRHSLPRLHSIMAYAFAPSFLFIYRSSKSCRALSTIISFPISFLFLFDQGFYILTNNGNIIRYHNEMCKLIKDNSLVFNI